MDPRKIKIFATIAILTFALIGFWVPTQWAASKFFYQPSLGQPLTVIAHRPIYPPFAFMKWYFVNYRLCNPAGKAILDKGLLMIAVAGFFLPLVAITIAIKSRRRKLSTTHGSARWADNSDVEKSGLLPRTDLVAKIMALFKKLKPHAGVFLGIFEGKYLRHDGSEHCLAMAPTRSGKGVGLIIPTLLTWLHSCVITDIKGENWGITAGFRKLIGQIVLKFDPTSSDGSSCRFNPLEEIRIRTMREVSDTQNIVNILLDPDGKGLDHWGKTGGGLLVGTIIHILYAEKDKTLRGVGAFLSDPSRSSEETLLYMLNYEHIKPDDVEMQEIYECEPGPHPVVASAARELLNKSENERSGVLSTAMSFLGLYRDPIIAKNTCVSDFKITDLMNHKKAVSLYLVIPPSDIARTIALIRMVLNLIVCRLTESMEFKDGLPVVNYKHRLLLLLDEFPAFGCLESLEKSFAYIAGYGLKAFLIVQSINQLFKAYGPNTSIVDNCHIRAVYTPNDEKTPQYISNMLGATTVFTQSKSFSGDGLNLWMKKETVSESETGRQLMTPGEVSQMSADDEIVFVAGLPPIKAKKIKYYEDQNFTERLYAAPSKSDRIYNVGVPNTTRNSVVPAVPDTTDNLHNPELSALSGAPSNINNISNMENISVSDTMSTAGILNNAFDASSDSAAPPPLSEPPAIVETQVTAVPANHESVPASDVDLLAACLGENSLDATDEKEGIII